MTGAEEVNMLCFWAGIVFVENVVVGCGKIKDVRLVDLGCELYAFWFNDCEGILFEGKLLKEGLTEGNEGWKYWFWTSRGIILVVKPFNEFVSGIVIEGDIKELWISFWYEIVLVEISLS